MICRIDPAVINKHHKMDVWSRRLAGIPLIANRVALLYHTAYLHSIVIEMSINSCNVVPMADLDTVTQAGAIPSCPDNFSTVGCLDRYTIGSRNVDTRVRSITAAPVLILRDTKCLSDVRSLAF